MKAITDFTNEEIREELKRRGYFFSLWSIDDLRDMEGAEELTDDQLHEIGSTIGRCHDATIGINWDVIQCHLDDYLQDLQDKNNQ